MPAYLLLPALLVFRLTQPKLITQHDEKIGHSPLDPGRLACPVARLVKMIEECFHGDACLCHYAICLGDIAHRMCCIAHFTGKVAHEAHEALVMHDDRSYGVIHLVTHKFSTEGWLRNIRNLCLSIFCFFCLLYVNVVY